MNKKVLTIFTFALLGIFAFSFVSATVNGLNFGGISSTLEKAWGQYVQGDISSGIVKILLFFLVAAIVYMILEGVFPDYPGIMIAISAVIGFLSTAYFTPSQVLSVMLSYEGFGLAISTLIPVAVLAVLTYRSVQRPGNNPNLILALFQYIAWGAFALFMVFRLLYAIFDTTRVYSVYDLVPVMIVTIGAALIFLFNRRIRRMLMSHTDNLVAEGADRNTRAAARQTRRQAAAEGETAGTNRRRFRFRGTGEDY